MALLVIIASGVASNHLVVSGDPSATAQNLVAHVSRFRIGILGEFVMLNGDVVLAVALYALLKPVDAHLALLGAFWRFANAIVLSVGFVASLVALDFLGVGTGYLGGERFLAAFTPEQRHVMAMQFLDVHDTGMFVGIALFGLGAATHGYLLWRSRYIPRALSAPYIVVAAIIVISCGAIVLAPGLDAIIDPWFVLPDFVVEVLVALWLVTKGATIRRFEGR